MRRNPLVYEINTVVWLNGLSKRYGRPITLGNIPAEILDELARWRFDAIWMMGVWERSPKGREVARNHPGLQDEYARALPGFTSDQVVGSPYAVYRYSVDPAFGGREGLAALRRELERRGMKLFLDYVPNHVASDHAWTLDVPYALVRGGADDLARDPSTYYAITLSGGEQRVFAHGRDPYFPAWSDTVQIDAFSPEAREKTRETLLDLATQCDGVRCDMAMLLVTHIFAMTWNRQQKPAVEFWAEIIPAIRAKYPEFLFMAEVYWDMEGDMQALGFDYTYDKRLYDRELHEPVHTVRDHLTAGIAYQQKMVRFVENHDEPRALTAFGPKLHPAAVMAATLPGMSLFYDGQFEGRQVKLPVQLGAAPDEAPQQWLTDFYRILLEEANHAIYHNGTFMLLGAIPLPGSENANALHDSLISYAWALGEDWRIIAANFRDQPVQARVILPRPAFSYMALPGYWNVLERQRVEFSHWPDVLTGGLPLELPAYGAKILRLDPAQKW